MFGFLFKKNKSQGKDSRRSSKELKKDNNALPPIDKEISAVSSRNLVSSSTDSLSPSSVCESISKETESGNFSLSVDHSSASSLINGEGPETNVKTSEEEHEKDDIQFIDDLQSENEIPSLEEKAVPVSPTAPAATSLTSPLGVEDDSMRQLHDAERKAMVQLDAVRSKLISKETELSLLQADINMLAVDRDNKSIEVQSLTSQLNMLKAENELALKRIHELEIQLEELRSKNSQLSEEVLKKSDQLKYLRDEKLSKPIECEGLSSKIKDLEEKIKSIESEKRQIARDRDLLEREKDGQVKALQDALDDALESKIKLQTKYEKELSELQQSNSSLVDDFEWKLHQVESASKKKLLEKDRQLEEKIIEAKASQQQSLDLSEERKRLEEERRGVQEQIRQVAHLKSYEAEVVQLRGVTDEQQKSLRAASRQLEQFKLNERLMQNEITSLKTLLEKEKTHSKVINNSTQRRLDAQEIASAELLQKQKADLNKQWEEKLRDESARLKHELIMRYTEDKHLAVQCIQEAKDADLAVAKESWDNARKELVQEISKLKETLQTKETAFQKEVAKATTVLDRDNWEIRRKMDKMNDEHLEEVEALKESHTGEIDNLKKQYDTALEDLEKLQRKLEEYEKGSSRSSDSVEEKDSGIAADPSSQSVDKTDELGCSSEDEEEDTSEDEGEESEDEEGQDDTKFHSISELREEVNALQDSVETLTLSLIQTEEGKTGKGPSSSLTSGAPDLIQECQDSSHSESCKSLGNESSLVSDTDESESESSSMFRYLPISPRRFLDIFRSYRLPDFSSRQKRKK